MKLLVPVLTLIAASLTGITDAGIQYDDNGGVIIPESFQPRSNSRVGSASYDKHGSIFLPRSLSYQQGQPIRDSEGRIIGIQKVAAAASQEGKSGGGITYTSEGGIILPNQRMAAAKGDSDGMACGKSSGDVNCVPMPYSMGNSNRGTDSKNKKNKQNIVTYDSQGGIVLPNSVAQSSTSKNDNGAKNTDDDSVPMPFSRSNKGVVNQKQPGVSNNANVAAQVAATPQQQQGYRQGYGYFYDLEGHRGSCGEKPKNTDMVVALSASTMGTDKGPNNENCGKELEVEGSNGNKVNVKVVDYCNTCSEDDLDLSPAAYEKIAQLNALNTTIKWHFI